MLLVLEKICTLWFLAHVTRISHDLKRVTSDILIRSGQWTILQYFSYDIEKYHINNCHVMYYVLLFTLTNSNKLSDAFNQGLFH